MIAEIQEGFAQHTPTFTDEYGSFYIWLEGSHGGQTVMIWLEEPQLHSVLHGLKSLCFKGRIALVIHDLPGLATPFARALHWTDPRKVLIVEEGEGVGGGFAGSKEVAEGVWVGWDDPRPGRLAQYTAASGLEFSEPRTYVPWQHSLPVDTLPWMDGPAIGGQALVPTYGLGLSGIEVSLRLLLQTWRLLEG